MKRADSHGGMPPLERPYRTLDSTALLRQASTSSAAQATTTIVNQTTQPTTLTVRPDVTMTPQPTQPLPTTPQRTGSGPFLSAPTLPPVQPPPPLPHPPAAAPMMLLDDGVATVAAAADAETEAGDAQDFCNVCGLDAFAPVPTAASHSTPTPQTSLGPLLSIQVSRPLEPVDVLINTHERCVSMLGGTLSPMVGGASAGSVELLENLRPRALAGLIASCEECLRVGGPIHCARCECSFHSGCAFAAREALGLDPHLALAQDAATRPEWTLASGSDEGMCHKCLAENPDRLEQAKRREYAMRSANEAAAAAVATAAAAEAAAAAAAAVASSYRAAAAATPIAAASPRSSNPPRGLAQQQEPFAPYPHISPARPREPSPPPRGSNHAAPRGPGRPPAGSSAFAAAFASSSAPPFAAPAATTPAPAAPFPARSSRSPMRQAPPPQLQPQPQPLQRDGRSSHRRSRSRSPPHRLPPHSYHPEHLDRGAHSYSSYPRSRSRSPSQSPRYRSRSISPSRRRDYSYRSRSRSRSPRHHHHHHHHFHSRSPRLHDDRGHRSRSRSPRSHRYHSSSAEQRDYQHDGREYSRDRSHDRAAPSHNNGPSSAAHAASSSHGPSLAAASSSSAAARSAPLSILISAASSASSSSGRGSVTGLASSVARPLPAYASYSPTSPSYSPTSPPRGYPPTSPRSNSNASGPIVKFKGLDNSAFHTTRGRVIEVAKKSTAAAAAAAAPDCSMQTGTNGQPAPSPKQQRKLVLTRPESNGSALGSGAKTSSLQPQPPLLSHPSSSSSSLLPLLSPAAAAHAVQSNLLSFFRLGLPATNDGILLSDLGARWDAQFGARFRELNHCTIRKFVEQRPDVFEITQLTTGVFRVKLRSGGRASARATEQGRINERY